MAAYDYFIKLKWTKQAFFAVVPVFNKLFNSPDLYNGSKLQKYPKWLKN